MSTPKSIIDAQIQHLLNVVEQHRAARCAEIQQQAQKKAQMLVRKAHRDARSRVHNYNASARENTQRQLTSAEALLQTRKRLARQQTDEDLLQAGWNRLKDSLVRHWLQADSRKQWIDNLLDQALARLVTPNWRVEHPVDWAEEERTALQKRLHGQLGYPPELEAIADISEGLRFCTEGTCVDGTADGLMHERTRIEALMLAAIHKRGDSDHV